MFLVTVPATSANLGPGFDTLGIALSLYNKVRFIPGQEGLSFTGPGTETLPLDESNLLWKAFEAVFKSVDKPVPRVRIESECAIPLERGLGSSAAAVVAGLLGANALLGELLSRDELLELAVSFEGHPDNVAPALFGGLMVAMRQGGAHAAYPIPVPKEPGLVVAVPRFRLATKKARSVLPRTIPISDVVYNLSRVTLLTYALVGGRLELLANALGDRLHEPYREPLVPGMAMVKQAAIAAGAWGVVLSGAGPTLVAFGPPELASKIAEAMRDNWECEAFPCGIDHRGAQVLNCEDPR